MFPAIVIDEEAPYQGGQESPQEQAAHQELLLQTAEPKVKLQRQQRTRYDCQFVTKGQATQQRHRGTQGQEGWWVAWKTKVTGTEVRMVPCPEPLPVQLPSVYQLLHLFIQLLHPSAYSFIHPSSIKPSTHHPPSIHSFLYPPTASSIYTTHSPIYPLTDPSVHPSILHPPIHSFLHPFTHLFMDQSTHPFIIHSSIYPSTPPTTYSSTDFSTHMPHHSPKHRSIY